MPGRKPAEAVENYLRPLRQSISCLTKSVLKPTKPEVDTVLVATFFGTALIPTKDGEKLGLRFTQHFSIESQLFREYKIKTRLYDYKVEDQNGHEIFSYHWHPESKVSPIPFPHMHLSHGAAERLRREFHRNHLPTGRVAFEEVAILLLDGFNVEPQRPDAREILSANLEVFRKHKTW